MSHPRAPFLAAFLLIVLSGLVLYLMGRQILCPCGYVLPWYGALGTAEGNMHLTDWYTPSHVIHGFAFFGVGWLVLRRLSLGWRFALATLAEVSWEILENTPAVIQHYRDTTVSVDYMGDSVVNSTADVIAMWLGFLLARRLPIWASVAICLGFEVWTTLAIRDGLALNILMLLAPSETVLNWQSGG
ncbi:DUF2585 family protein [Aestuariicoccus sp. KMU-90]|uniref:DUF2585 family protein n=2 Tax=Thetidibacter halocola TaxID=2827239 RepID=A0A8J8B8T3_9RHOB|nr:DUF2585 family protein [Thetidibacter halocola]MBS0123483.1 DUF2585 family protein [Thetidibacter halocola]